ncbi:MAG TPA: hypothetical protein VK862_19765, partial [Afifellaceae bacterium]|nr:hypothetical protein [Afifellaceae bacterium]
MVRIKYPYMRRKLIYHTYELSDREHQIKYWIDKDKKYTDTINSVDEILHFFLDDTELLENPEKCIGYFLKINDEAEIFQYLSSILLEIVEKYPDINNERAISLPEWDF